MIISNWVLCLTASFALLGMFSTKISYRLNMIGACTVLVGGVGLVLNALLISFGKCFWGLCSLQEINVFDSMIFCFVALTSFLIHYHGNNNRVAESTVALKVARLIVGLILGSFYFKDYVHFYFFYEIVGMLFLFLIGYNLYFEKKRTFYVITAVSFSITLVNFLCIFSLYSLVKQEGNDFAIPLIVINDLIELHASIWWVKLIFRVQIIAVFVKALVLPFYFVKTGDTKTNTHFLIFLFMLIVNMLLAVYASNTFLKEFLHFALINNINFLVIGGVLVVVLALFLFIRFKTISDFFRLLVFFYSFIFVITYLLFITEKTVLDYMAVADFVAVIFGLYLIERVLRQRFGDPGIRSSLGLEYNMPRFYFIFFLWLVLLTGAPFFASGLIRISYASVLFNYSITRSVVFYSVVVLFLFLIIPFFKNVSAQPRDNKINAQDISFKEVLLLGLPLALELLMSWQWIH